MVRLAVMFGFIAAVNLAGWGIFVWYVMPHHVDYRGVAGGGGLGVGLGVAVTAWFLGFRHAFDADHISCIDNTTRKLMADGQRPLGTGFFFAAIQGLPYYAVLALPLLFAGGMMLFDTLDGCFMNFAYGWAFARPVRKVYYNLVITGLSIGAAFIVGTIEILGVLTSEVHLRGAFWDTVANFDINVAGFAIAGLFVVVWAVALLYWRLGNVEARWTPGSAVPDPGQESDPDGPSAAGAALYRRNRPAEGPGG